MRRRIARTLVWLANQLVRGDDSPAVWPLYRPVDTHIAGIGDHEFACGAYSYEHLKSLVEQDGPDGFGSTATIRWLISPEGWEPLEDMPLADLKALFATSGMGVQLLPEPSYATAAPRAPRLTISFEPRDVWIGWFWDRRPDGVHHYLCPLPCLVIHWRTK
ncbi:hypothetical protein [Mycolicibacterium llatzerense]|uniref:hypothetical protein n=1 Tax=Mycolicibacterium llatzerense TaxID=280871 RepID=UPI0021B67BD6|nr:hypothetical protein [Mycolicibacterium llatzerense]MCT7361322.1 hypothetical protein [Mycolicibacterium llatzerense]